MGRAILEIPCQGMSSLAHYVSASLSTEVPRRFVPRAHRTNPACGIQRFGGKIVRRSGQRDVSDGSRPHFYYVTG